MPAPSAHSSSSDNSNAHQPLLEIRELRKRFGGLRAVDGIDLDVFSGQIVGVIGPNGSGKTTTFNVITGLTRADGGSIRWGDERRELLGSAPWKIFGFGIARTFQNIRLSLGLSIVENVLVGLYPRARTSWPDVLLATRRNRRRHDEVRERALEAVRFVSPSLARVSEKLVAELSYADRRRVEIARAIVSKPNLLLLDEPTAGMNPGETDELAAEVRKIRDTGVTILLVEHKMKFISDLADRVAVLNFGQKIAEGSYEEVRSNPAVIEAYLGRRRAA